MASNGHVRLEFHGIISWGEFKKQIELASRGIPDTATVMLETNGSSDKNLVEQSVVANWDLAESDGREGAKP